MTSGSVAMKNWFPTAGGSLNWFSASTAAVASGLRCNLASLTPLCSGYSPPALLARPRAR
jgi:hypothetical protein